MKSIDIAAKYTKYIPFKINSLLAFVAEILNEKY